MARPVMVEMQIAKPVLRGTCDNAVRYLAGGGRDQREQASRSSKGSGLAAKYSSERDPRYGAARLPRIR